MKLIVAADRNWAIGGPNGLLYKIPADMQHFKEQTLHKIVIMGENTLKSLPHSQPLKNRINIVLSQDMNFYPKNCIVCHNLEELFAILDKDYTSNVVVIGGATIYNLLYPYCECAYITKVDAETSGATAFIPNFDTLKDWHLETSSPDIITNNIRINFNCYVNNNVKIFGE